MVKRKKRGIIVLVGVVSVFVIILLYQGLNISSNNWTKMLPVCPCKAPDVNQLNDGWAFDKASVGIFHKGAALSIRSYPAVKTIEGQSGQQCCYDKDGNLLTTGLGAGTPDRSGTCIGEDENGMMIVDYKGVFNHFFKDVFPFFVMEIKEYHKYWTPDKGKNCKNE